MKRMLLATFSVFAIISSVASTSSVAQTDVDETHPIHPSAYHDYSDSSATRNNDSKRHAQNDNSGSILFPQTTTTSLRQPSNESMVSPEDYTQGHTMAASAMVAKFRTRNPNLELIAAINSRDYECVHGIVSKGACDLNCTDMFGRTPLYFAAQSGDIALVRYLIDEGHASVNRPLSMPESQFWDPPLFAAVIKGQTKLVDMLINTYNADVKFARDPRGRNALMLAAVHNHTDIVRSANLKQVDVDARDNNNQTALMMAAKLQNIQMVRFLVDEGNANVNIEDIEGHPALFFATNAARAENAEQNDVMPLIGNRVMCFLANHPNTIRRSLERPKSLTTFGTERALEWRRNKVLQNPTPRSGDYHLRRLHRTLHIAYSTTRNVSIQVHPASDDAGDVAVVTSFVNWTLSVKSKQKAERRDRRKLMLKVFFQPNNASLKPQVVLPVWKHSPNIDRGSFEVVGAGTITFAFDNRLRRIVGSGDDDIEDADFAVESRIPIPASEVSQQHVVIEDDHMIEVPVNSRIEHHLVDVLSLENSNVEWDVLSNEANVRLAVEYVEYPARDCNSARTLQITLDNRDWFWSRWLPRAASTATPLPHQTESETAVVHIIVRQIGVLSPRVVNYPINQPT